MKTTFQSTLQACLALIVALCASCTDDTFLQDDVNATGKRFELTVTQAAPQTRLELGQDGLTLKWEPGDQLVLIDKGRTKAPIYLTCDLTEAATSATFSAQTGVPAGDYWVIYNYNDNLVYTHRSFSSVEDINTKNKLVLWGELNIVGEASEAEVAMHHLYSKIHIKLKNAPTGDMMGETSSYTIGMYSTKKGFAVSKQFTSNGLEAVEYGYNPNTMNNYSYNCSYFASNKRWHNIRFGSYNLEYDYQETYDETTGQYTYNYTQKDNQPAEANSALVLPEDFTGEDVFFYVLQGYECYEIKFTDIKLLAGTSYTVELDLSMAKHSTITTSLDSDNSFYIAEISSPAEWRAVAYYNRYNHYTYNYIDGVNITQDINFENEHFHPIYATIINGNGKKLSNINLERSSDDVGLYKWEWNSNGNEMCEVVHRRDNTISQISNLTLENVTFIGKDYVGAFGGISVAVNNCEVIGTSTITGENHVGGIVGVNWLPDYNQNYLYLRNVSIKQNCSVNGANYVGGIVGRYEKTPFNGYSYETNKNILDNCISLGTVTATGDYVGGIFGKIGGGLNEECSSVEFQLEDQAFTIQRCQNSGSVTGRNYVGGIGGSYSIYASNGGTDKVVLTQSFSDGAVSGSNYVGGILGASYASVNTCYSINTISGASKVGGIMGAALGGMNNRVANSYSLSGITASESDGISGGIVGDATQTGMAGTQTFTAIRCYFAGSVSSNKGILGLTQGLCTIENCLTRLNDLGNGTHEVQTGTEWVWDENLQQNVDKPIYTTYTDVVTNSFSGVESILENIAIINDPDNAYSTNIWPVATYPGECCKFASFSADTNAPSFGSDGWTTPQQ